MTGTNACFLLGQLAEPVESVQTKSGKSFIKAAIEVKTYRRGLEGEPAQEELSVIPVCLFGRTGQILQRHVQPGDAVGLMVRVTGTEFRPPNGPSKRGVSLVAESVHLIPNGRRQASPKARKEEEVPSDAEWL